MLFSQKRLSVAILVALLFSCTLALFGPAQIYFTNILEFNFSFTPLLPWLGIITFCVFLPVMILLMVLPERFKLHERGVAVVFILGFLLWVEGNFLVWNYGLLNGHKFEWGDKVLFGLIDTPIWIVGLLLAVLLPAFFYRRAKTFSLLLLLIQLLATSFYVIRQPESPSFKKYQIDLTGRFDFSSHKNIIILILDSFQSDVFQEIIDQDPSYEEYFKDFTYFRNTLGGFPSTYAAVPFIMTAQYYTNSQPIQSFIADAYLSPSSIPHELLERGWRVDLFPAVNKSVFFDPKTVSNIEKFNNNLGKAKLAYLYDLTLFRHLPHFFKRWIYNNENWFLLHWGQKGGKANLLDGDDSDVNGRSSIRVKRKARRSSPHVSQTARRFGIAQVRKSAPINSDSRFVSNFLMQAAVLIDSNTFKFYHLRGPHEPIHMNANLQPVELPLNRANLVDLARGELKLVRLFLGGLRELGVYDQALIFILGDHGHPWGGYGVRLHPGMTEKITGSDFVPINVLASGIPLLLVKRPGDRGDFRISNAPASLADVSATIFDDLGLGPHGIGQPLFQIPVDRLRERRFLYYNWTNSDWMNRYLPPLVEYRVVGNSWLASSWQATGKVFKPGG